MTCSGLSALSLDHIQSQFALKNHIGRKSEAILLQALLRFGRDSRRKQTLSVIVAGGIVELFQSYNSSIQTDQQTFGNKIAPIKCLQANIVRDYFVFH